MKTTKSLVYPREFSLSCQGFGAQHPFKIERYQLTYQLLEEFGLLEGDGFLVTDPEPAAEEALLRFHREDYLRTLREFSRDETPRANFIYGLGDVENPIFKGVYDWSRLVCGGTMKATRLVIDGGCRLAFSMTGGMHHAHAAKASGFSYLNDAVVAIQAMVDRGLRVAYVDIDAHHGDGVQWAFYDSDKVLTISLHETGKDFFPHTGFATEVGSGEGYGYSVNVPLAAHSDDLVFEQAFRHVVRPLLDAYRPDLLVTQLGVDGLRTDPLTRLEFTTASLELAIREFMDTGIPWAALGGGGYDRFNVARGWTLAWALMCGCEVADELPPGFLETAASCGVHLDTLRDRPHLAQPDDFARAQEELERSLRIIERRIFPLHGILPGVC